MHSSVETRFLPSWMIEKSSLKSSKIQVQKPEEFIKFNKRIEYCVYPNVLASCVEEILTKIDSTEISEVVYGFDMEWPVIFHRPKKTALIQICTDHSNCYLFHVYHMVKLPSVFIYLINHPRVRWSGVCIKNDFLKLSRDFNIDVSGALSRSVELSSYANNILNFDPYYRWSMARLVQELLKTNVNKDNHIRMGHWENINLDQEQCMYAATDAYVSLLLYEHLRKLEARK